MNTTIFTAGIACAIAGIVGGGMKGLGLEIPVLRSVRRQAALVIFGFFLMLVGATDLVTMLIKNAAASRQSADNAPVKPASPVQPSNTTTENTPAQLNPVPTTIPTLTPPASSAGLSKPAAKAPPVKLKTTQAGGSDYIEVKAFYFDRESASNFLAELRSKGHEAFIVEYAVFAGTNKTQFILMGPFNHEGGAAVMLQRQLVNEGYKDAHIIDPRSRKDFGLERKAIGTTN